MAGNPPGRYGKIYASFWDNAEFEKWSADECLVALNLMTNDRCNMVGCYRMAFECLPNDVRMPFQRCKKAVETLEKRGFLVVKGSWVLIPKFLKWNWPSGANQLKGAKRKAEEIRDVEFREYVVGVLSGTPFEWRSDAVGTQEQEQKQEQEQNNTMSVKESPTDSYGTHVVWEHYLECFRVLRKSQGRASRKRKLTDKDRRAIRVGIDSVGVDGCKDAISGMFRHPHNLGKNDRETEYLGIHLALKPENLDRFIGQASAPAPKQSQKFSGWMRGAAELAEEHAEQQGLQLIGGGNGQ